MINHKNIIRSTVKRCLVCEEDSDTTGITILGNFICEKCISDINKLTVNDEKYYEVKEKLKGILSSYL